jgi:hypothetical protein
MKPAAFDATARNAVTGVGAPWYTSGTQIWKGNAPILNATPEITSTIPAAAMKLCGLASRNPSRPTYCIASAVLPGSPGLPATPYRSAIPKRRSAELSAPMTRYLSPASSVFGFVR